AKENSPNAYQLIGRSANAIEPGKRMLSSMTPTVVTRNDEPFLITGSPGGSTIITTVLQVIINVIDHGMGVDDAVAAPRFHHQWQPDSVTYEKYGISPDTIDLLRKKGHKEIKEARYGRGIGDANTILYGDGLIQGAKDPRGEGGALGY
ncbi:MAG: gamma-glutamyltransferase, partial [Gammaproteobacteria bacterium]|nr:gamma-glutamyltransferase [Gammaproteobacteria bacterium]